MSKNEVVKKEERLDEEILAKILTEGDLSGLSDAHLIRYHEKRCKDVGIEVNSNAFSYIVLNGKKILYANKGATEQLRKIHGISLEMLDEKQVGDTYTVRVKATDKEGRFDIDIGSTSIKGKSGTDLANAQKIAWTQAKRRVTLSICGLGMLDESEIVDIPKEALRTPTSPKKEETEVIETEAMPKAQEEERELTGGALIATFKTKAFENGLTPPLLRDFSKAQGIKKGEEGEKVMQKFLKDDIAFKEAMAIFLDGKEEDKWVRKN